MISAIAAMASNRVIGKDNAIPWHVPEDFAWFKEKTLGKPVIMGRKTHESIGRALPKRDNIVITRNREYKPLDDSVIVFSSLDSAVRMYADQDPFIIGGTTIYEQSLILLDRIYLTEIHAEYDGDAFFPELGPEWVKAYDSQPQTSKKGVSYSFYIYERS